MGIGNPSAFDQTPPPPVTRCAFPKTMESIPSPWVYQQCRTMTVAQRRLPKFDRLNFVIAMLDPRLLGAGETGRDPRLAQGNGGVARASIATRTLLGPRVQMNYKILHPPTSSRTFSHQSLRRHPSLLSVPRPPPNPPLMQQTTSANTANTLYLKIYRTMNLPIIARNRGLRQGNSHPRTSPRVSLPLTYRKYSFGKQYLGHTFSSPRKMSS